MHRTVRAQFLDDEGDLYLVDFPSDSDLFLLCSKGSFLICLSKYVTLLMGNTPDWGAAARSQLSGLPWYLRPPRNTMALIANEGPEKEEGEGE